MGAISDLQSALIAQLRADNGLKLLIGADGIFDAPPKGRMPPYVTILSHDAIPIDGDADPAFEHKLVLHCWSEQPSRKAASEIANRVESIALGRGWSGDGIEVSARRHIRTETVIDTVRGRARAAVQLRFLTQNI